MYIQRVPHPLMRYRSRDPSPLNALQSSPHSASAPHSTGYVVLAVVIAILLCSLIGFLMARRLLPLSLSWRTKNKMPRRTQDPAMQSQGHPQFDSVRDNTSSPEPPSPCSEGPPTPCADYEHEEEYDGDLGVRSKSTQFDPCAHVLYINHTDQMYLYETPAAPDSSAIRPHGLPLWPVPEEPSMISTLPSVYDDNELFYRPPPTQ